MEELYGLIGFPLAPFKDDLSLDRVTLEADVDALASHPFCAINAPAGISEIFSLSLDEAVAMAESTVAVVAGRMPVIGCVASSWPASREMARRLERAGADALLVTPPAYPNAPFDGLLAYYRAIGEACGLPLIIYSRGWASFTPSEVERLAEAVPTLRYWKDGQGDPRAYRRIMNRVGARLIWIGGSGDDNAAAYSSIGIDVYTNLDSRDASSLGASRGIHINGGAQNSKSVTVDGHSILDIGNNTELQFQPNMDSIAEINVLTSNYQAAFGRNSAGVISIISKSGTQDFHGTGYFFWRHESLNATNFFRNRTGTPKAPYRYRIPGFSVGGPVYIPKKFNTNKDKLGPFRLVVRDFSGWHTLDRTGRSGPARSEGQL